MLIVGFGPGGLGFESGHLECNDPGIIRDPIGIQTTKPNQQLT